MQNLGMGYDARAVANAILDMADEANIKMGNLSINKILFFCHSDSIVERQHRLVNLTFEAWKFGPVLPIIYHQFKKYGSDDITSRAMGICRETGDDVVVPYTEITGCLPFLKTCLMTYGTLSPSALIGLSHVAGGPWDVVWNSHDPKYQSMKITDQLIQDMAAQQVIPGMNGNNYAH